MILQTGFRTDIPSFYSAWFANRLRAGFVLVRNPYAPQSVTRYAINPDVVDLAEQKGLVVMATNHTMFVACGLLYAEGLRGGPKRE